MLIRGKSSLLPQGGLGELVLRDLDVEIDGVDDIFRSIAAREHILESRSFRQPAAVLLKNLEDFGLLEQAPAFRKALLFQR